MTIVSTAKKLMVNPYRYLFDRISQTFEMPSLANLIESIERDIAYEHSG